MTKSRNNVIILQAIKNYTILKWGLGRSPKRGEGGSPTFSPFPRGRGLGLGIENLLYFYKKQTFSTNSTIASPCAKSQIQPQNLVVFN